MKTHPAGYAAHVAGSTTTLALGLKITRRDAVVKAFTSHDRNVTISSVLYEARPGLDASQLVSAAGLQVGNLELRTLHDGTVFSAFDLLTRVWENARYTIFRFNWANTADGINTLSVGTLGEIKLRQNMLVAELRDLRQYFSHEVGNKHSKNCRNRLGDAKCTVALGPFTVTGAVTAVASNSEFTDSSRAEAADTFGNGEFVWTSGDNAGLEAKIESFAAGVFTLVQPTYADIQVGDEYQAIAGCRKRKDTDCRDKFDNVINYGGEWDSDGMLDRMTRGVAVTV